MVGYILLAICLVLICLPPKWDPAIRWKEMQIGHRKNFWGKE